MTPMALTFSLWAYYMEVITVECDICYEAMADVAGDAMEADEQARLNDWYTDIQCGDQHYDHICYGCGEELHFCASCEEAIWCDDALHCEDAYCSEACLNDSHLTWGEDNPQDVECSECSWENPSAIQDAPSIGVWAVA